MPHRLLIALLLLAAAAQAGMVRVKLAGQPRPVTMDLEEYVAAALAGEAGGFRSLEALKAMAVVARTFARANMGRHRAQGYDFCETTHCQDVRARSVTARLRKAAGETEGVILWSGGRPALVFYTEHCGGRTENARSLWPGAGRTYLRGVDDSFCLSASRLPWRAALPLTEIARSLGLRETDSLAVASRSGTGRVALLSSGGRAVSGEAFHLAIGRTLGWNHLRSKLYDLRIDHDRALFEGWGRGHGVGLCQTGADERGKAGHTWQQILAAYFPGTRAGISAKDIPWTPMHSERAEIHAAGGAGDEQVPAAVDRGIAEAETLSGRRLAFRPVVRVFPSVALFRDATGEPGFVAASTHGRTIRLQPAGRLIGEGRLGSVLLHEMLHLALSPAPGVRLPRWFEEGLVLWLEQPVTKAEKLDPRTEDRLLKPATEAQLRAAYSNARGAVAHLVSQYGRQTVLQWADSGLPAAHAASK